MKKIPIAKPWIDENEWKSLKVPLFNGWLTQGALTNEFEKKFALYHNSDFASATTSCTTALHLGLIALGIKNGDEVIVPSFTWVSTANVVEFCGAKPVFADVERATFNLDLNDVKKKITKKTKAIIAVHLFGLCCNISKLRKIIPKNVKILEDAACASGSSFNGNFPGSIGDAAAFSFHPRKIITTGEGGMITTHSKKIKKEVDILRNMGASISDSQRHNGPTPYILPDFKKLGFNYRMTDIQASIGLVQLRKLKSIIKERKQIANFFQKNLCDVEWLTLPKEPKGYSHSWQAYVTIVNSRKAPYTRNKIMEILDKKGVSTRPGTQAVHMLHYYKKKYKIKDKDLSNSKYCYENTMAIPLYNGITKRELSFIVKCIKEIN